MAGSTRGPIEWQLDDGIGGDACGAGLLFRGRIERVVGDDGCACDNEGQGDTTQFRRFLAGNPDRLRKRVESARASGAVHHRFGVGDGFLAVIDDGKALRHSSVS